MSFHCMSRSLRRPATKLAATICQPAWNSQRLLNNSARSHAAHQPPRRDPKSEDKQEPKQSSSPAPPSRSFDDIFSPRQANGANTSAATSAAIDGLFSSSGIGKPRRTIQSSSSDDMSRAQSRHTFGAGFSKPGTNLRPKALDWENMAMPTGDAMVAPAPKTPVIREEDITYPRLNATTGRSVELDPSKGRDIVRGIGMLSSLIARNGVRNDFNKQKFHERPGLKRKRLKTERWRARFKVGFQDVCARVTELTKKGW